MMQLTGNIHKQSAQVQSVKMTGRRDMASRDLINNGGESQRAVFRSHMVEETRARVLGWQRSAGASPDGLGVYYF